jgi:hypothetical protein
VNRAEAVTYLADRYGEYLSAASRAATDASGKTLRPVLDDAFRALGYVAADIPTATTDGEEADEDLRVQAAYRAMQQISRDLGATSFDLSTGGDSFRLSQVRAAAEKDLQLATDAVLDRFGTLGIVTGESDNPFVTIDLNFLTEPWPCRVLA